MLKTLTPGAAAEAEGETPLLETLVRQKAAGTGKELPDAPQGEAGDEDETVTDPSFAWFVIAQPVPEPAPALRFPVSAAAIRLPEGATLGLAAEPAPAPVAETATPAAVELSPDLAAPDAPAEFALPAQPGETPVKAKPAELAAAPEQPEAPIRIELPPAREAAPRPQPVTLAAIQPRAEAVQPLAAPLAAASIEPRALRRTGPRDATIQAPAATAAPEAPRPQVVVPAADTQQPQLDMRHREWTTSMVERIEALRDASPARETNIRLAPDALGSVDISIRQEGDRVHVRFSAENATARTLLTEAQPRLAELAEARGLRLGQTSVDAGTAGQGGQRHDAAPRPAFASAPASALSGDSATDSDERIA